MNGQYVINSCRKAVKSMVAQTVMIVLLWGAIYHLTDFETVFAYFWMGIVVCILIAGITNIKNRKIDSLFRAKPLWIVMAGTVLLLHHAGFDAAAVFAAAAIFASPLFWATWSETIVGGSLLMVLVWIIP